MALLRALVRGAIVVVVTAGSLAVTTTAFAATDADTADAVETYTLVYSTNVHEVTTGPDGVQKAADFPGDVVLECTADSCTVTASPYYGTFLESVITAADAWTMNRVIEGVTSACDRTGQSTQTQVLTISPTGLSGTSSQPALDWEYCGDTRTYIHARTVTYAGTYTSGETCFLDESCPVPEPEPEPTPVLISAPVDGEPASAGTSSFLSSGDAAAPSVLSTLASPISAGAAPAQLALAALLTVVLVLLVAFPTALLNSAVESGSERVGQWWAGRRTTPTPDAPAPADSSRPTAARPWWWAGAGVALAALISAFVDPEFGFNAGSGRVLLSILVSFGIDVVLGWFLVIWLVRRVAPGATHSFVFKPVTLLVVVIAVVFTRITGFEPGIIFGLVAGVAFGALAGKASEAKAALATLGYAFGVAVLAWIAYGAMGGGATAGGSFWQTFLLETLASIAVGGMAALPVALFPIRGLAGFTIWAWNRWVWAGCYALGLFAFFVVLMPMPFSWAGVGWDLTAWIGVYLVYAIGAAILWAAVTRPWAKESAEPPSADAEASGSSHEPSAVTSVTVAEPTVTEES